MADIEPDAIVAALKERAAHGGAELTLDEFCRETGVSGATIQRKFGGWRKLRQLAGLPVRGSSVGGAIHSRAELAKKLYEAVHLMGTRISEREFCQWAGVSTGTIERLWGSWEALREGAGLFVRRHRPRRRCSLPLTPDLWQSLEDVIQKLGRWPTAEELAAHSRFPLQAFLRRAGTMAELKESHDYHVRRMARVAELRRLGELPPDVPSSSMPNHQQ